MQKIFETDYVNVFYNESSKQLEVIWTAETSSLNDAGFKKHVSQYAELVEKYGIRTIFVDARSYNHIVTAEVSKWHDAEIVPKYIKLGLKKIGFLQPEETFAQLGHQFIFDEEKAKMGCRYNSLIMKIRLANG